jgi:hypothetical protein
VSESNSKSVGGGIGAGQVIGMLLCWFKWHSIVALIWPAIFGWGYVFYFLIKYGSEL